VNSMRTPEHHRLLRARAGRLDATISTTGEPQLGRDRTLDRRQALKAAGLGVAALGLPGLLAACGASSASASHTSVVPTLTGPAKDVKGDITIWYGLDSMDSKSIATWTKYNVTPFEQQYPGVKVNATPSSGTAFSTRLRTALAAGHGPDIIYTDGSSDAIPFATAGYFANLDPAAKEFRWANTILPWALEMGRVDGKLASLPTSYETMVIYYNKTLFEANSWLPPVDRASLEALAAKIQAKGIIPFAAGNASYQGETEWLVSTFLNQVAGPKKVYDVLTGSAQWTDPAIEASIQLMSTYFDRGYFEGGIKQYFTTTDSRKLQQLADGEAAMYISGSWEMAGFADFFGAGGNQDAWAWAPLPPLVDGLPRAIYPLSVGGTISINSKVKYPEAALVYLAWMFSDTKSMWQAVVDIGNEPLPVKYSQNDVPSDVDPRYLAQYTALNKASQARDVGYVSWTSFGGKADNYVVENADKVLDHSLSIAAFCAGIGKAFDADKSAGLIPPVYKTND
jgi:raffinose/stachyose/melibiose transport system substrate-binding protein